MKAYNKIRKEEGGALPNIRTTFFLQQIAKEDRIIYLTRKILTHVVITKDLSEIMQLDSTLIYRLESDSVIDDHDDILHHTILI